MPAARHDIGERRAGGRAGEAEPWTSVRRDARRIQLFQQQVAEEAEVRRRAAALRMTVIIGLVIGLAGCVISLFV